MTPSRTAMSLANGNWTEDIHAAGQGDFTQLAGTLSGGITIRSQTAPRVEQFSFALIPMVR